MTDFVRRAGLAWLASAMALPPLRAQEKTTPPAQDSTRVIRLAPMEVGGRIDDLAGVALSASQGRVGIADLRLQPMAREGEVLEAIPGMILTQHSGDGKSNQMFVRGFNLDHGTDFSTRVEGMPVNMPTHGHGQGYTDLNFITPEFIDHLEYRLGVYYPDLGDFGSAGGAEIRFPTSLPRPVARIEVGPNNFGRAVLASSSRLGAGELLAGGEVKGYDGPWSVPQNLRKWSGLGRYTTGAPGNRLSLLFMTYGNRWDASDQIPERAVRLGDLSPFDQVDSTLGGRSRRHSLSASWSRIGQRGTLNANVYAVVSNLDLFSNFTYFLNDPVRGDQIEQVDERISTGFDIEALRFGRAFGRDHTVRIGAQTRFDEIDVGLHRTTSRARFATVRADDVSLWSGGAYTSIETRWSDRVRTVWGMRVDVTAASVRSDRRENSGTRTDAIATPSAAVIVAPAPGTEVYLGAGSGFHSNDARGTTTTVDPVTDEPVQRVDPLVRSIGGELGLRTAPAAAIRSTLSLWWLQLESELLFVGDAGTTEASGTTRRHGVTWASHWRILPSVSLDLDLSFARARYVDPSNDSAYVPNALERVVGAGVTWEAAATGPFAAARLRHLGGHPLVGDNSVRGTATTLINASAGWVFARVRATVSVLNALDADDADVQYYYGSRQRGEAQGIEGVHFHPAEPRQVRFGVSWGL